jgi:tetratricopeptide (TPR) repeat protein
VQTSRTALSWTETVDRYLDALRGASPSVRRREGANARSFLRHLNEHESDQLSREAIRQWLDASGEASHELRSRRFTTLRRLMALMPGRFADEMAAWMDTNRKQLTSGGSRGGKVIAIQAWRSRPQERIEQAERYMSDARRAFDRGEYSGAGALARRALKSHPACLGAHALLGILDLESKRPDLALRRFREAMVLAGDPGDRRDMEGIASVLDGLGRTMLYVGQVSDARDVYRKLARVSRAWEASTGPILGRIALMKGELEEAVHWFGVDDNSIGQYNVFLARMMESSAMKAAIAFCRATLGNPLVPPILTRTAEERFRESLDDARVSELSEAAHQYGEDFADLWAIEPWLIPAFCALWDHPATRSFLMRALPLSQSNPASPRLAVFVHVAASKLAEHLRQVGVVPPD